MSKSTLVKAAVATVVVVGALELVRRLRDADQLPEPVVEASDKVKAVVDGAIAKGAVFADEVLTRVNDALSTGRPSVGPTS